ncbi:MAG: flagellar basal body P-ring formation chaperone FlgA [Geminicoccaceae bacterium]
MMRLLFSCLLLVLLTTPALADRLLPGEPLTRERLESMLIAGLDGDGDGHRMEVRIHQPALPMANHARSPMELELVDIETDAENGTFDARLSARLESGESSLIGIRGRIEEMIPVVIPTRSFRRGDTVREQALEIRFEPQGRMREDVIASIEDVAGLEARKPLRRNQPVHVSDLRQPRLVRQGEIVEVLFRAPGIELAALAESLDDGSMGEIVRLANIDSGKRFRAIVTDHKKAVVTTSPMGARQ